MASGDRIQIVLEAKDEMSREISDVQKRMKELDRTAGMLAREVESGNKEAADSYESVRREIKQQEQQLERLRAERKVLAAEGRKQAQIEAKAAAEARIAAKRQEQAIERVSGRMDRLGRKIGLQGKMWDRLSRGAGTFERKWSHSFTKVGDEMDEHDRRGRKMLSGWGLAATGAVAAVAGAVAGIASSLGLIGDAINEARGARKALAQTGAVIRSMGRTESPKAVERLINQLERASGIDGDNLREMTNILFTFGNVTGDTFMKANELALDLSVAFGKDLTTSATMVGKALNDPTKGLTALTRVGVSFTAQQQEQVKAMMATGDLAGAQKIILGELTKQVAGSAAAQADSIDRSTVAWGNLKEAVGDVLLDTSTGVGLTKGLEGATKWIKQHKQEIISVLQAIMSAVFKLISVFLKWQSVVIGVLGYVVGAFAKVLEWAALLDPSLKGVAEGASSLAKGFGNASNAANTASQYFNDLSTKADIASQRSKDLADALKQIKGRDVKVNVRTTINDVWSAVDAAVDAANAPLPRFAGGPVWPGQPFMVGEIGPEVWIPRTGSPRVIGADGPEVRDFAQSGFVVPNHLVASVTLPPQRGAESAPAPVPGVQIGELHVHDRFDAEATMNRVLDRQRRLAAERGA